MVLLPWLLNTMDFITFFKEFVDKIFSCCCFIHQQLYAQKINMKHLRTDLVKAAHFIRWRGLINCEFKANLDEVGSEYKDAVYLSKVGWLSKRETLKIFLVLLLEIEVFSQERKQNVLFLIKLRMVEWFIFLCGHHPIVSLI